MIETLAGIAFIGLIISLIAFIIQLLRRKPNKKQWGIAIVCLLVAFLIAGALRPYYRSSDSSKRVEKVEKKTVEEPKQTKKEKKAKPAVKKQKKEVEEAGFAEIYTSFQENELVAKDKYNGKKYKIRAKINGMETGGLFNLTGGATLTMEDQVGNTIVFFYADFGKKEEKKLKRVKVGDEIVFIGECQDGNFLDCKLQ